MTKDFAAQRHSYPQAPQNQRLAPSFTHDSNKRPPSSQTPAPTSRHRSARPAGGCPPESAILCPRALAHYSNAPNAWSSTIDPHTPPRDALWRCPGRRLSTVHLQARRRVGPGRMGAQLGRRPCHRSRGRPGENCPVPGSPGNGETTAGRGSHPRGQPPGAGRLHRLRDPRKRRIGREDNQRPARSGNMPGLSGRDSTE